MYGKSKGKSKLTAKQKTLPRNLQKKIMKIYKEFPKDKPDSKLLHKVDFPSDLKKLDLFFVGIDIIGDYLTEINVTSPTGIKQINKLNNVKLEQVFWDKLEAKYKIV